MLQRLLIVIALGMLFPRGVAGGEVVTIPTATDAATLAQADISSLSSQDAGFQFYIWIEPWNRDVGYGVAAGMINEVISKSSVLFSPKAIVAGDVELVRFDVRFTAGSDEEGNLDVVALQEILDNLNLLQSRYFAYGRVNPVGARKIVKVQPQSKSFVRGQDIVEAGFLAPAGSFERKVWEAGGRVGKPPAVWETVKLLRIDGDRSLILHHGAERWHPNRFMRETTQFRRQTVAEQTVEDREESRALGDTAQLLPQFTNSNLPIIGLGELLSQIGHSDPDRRGLYYQFVGLIRNGRRLTFDELKAEFGVGEAEIKIPILKSLVTGKPRIIVIEKGNKVRADKGTGLFTYTKDTLDKQRGLNWLTDFDRFDAEAVAHEVIAERKNGTTLWAIYADQLLLDTVPDNVACNHKLPEPFTRRLPAGPLACGMCHAMNDAADGYRTAASDFLKLAERSPRFRAFFQQDQVLKNQGVQFNQILANNGQGGANVNVLLQDEYKVKQFNNFGLFEGLAGELFSSAEIAIQRGRQDRARNIAKVAGFRELTDESAATRVTQGGVRILLDYEFDYVTPRKAARDIGFETPDDATAAAVIARAVGTPVGFEDPVIIALTEELDVDRGTYELATPLLFNRAANLRLLHRK